jgi:uncharacterized membrane protein (DUF106 family)
MPSTPPDALLDDDPELADALATVLDRAERGDGTVTWDDVRDDVTSREWARLLQSGHLVAAGDAFVVDDPTAVRAALDASDDATDTDDSWSVADKAAGVCALTLMAGYQVTAIRDVVAGTLDVFLGPLQAVLPFPVVVGVLAVGTAVVSTTIQHRLQDTDEMARHRARLKRVSEQLSAARDRGDDEAVDRLQARQRELVGDQLGMLTTMLRPMVWTMLVVVPGFLWVSWLVVAPAQAIAPTATVFPMLGRVVWTARVFGPLQAWTLWYIGWSLVTSLSARKLLARRSATV